jgi:AraC family transcriptional regulator
MNREEYSEVDAVITYIHQHIYEPLTLSQLAAYVAYSPYYFSRMFKKKTGLSPLYYVSALRLQKAKDLLLNTDLGIRDIGLEIGQQSLGTFTTRFTEKVGMTPAGFRNAMQEAKDPLHSLQKLTDWSVVPDLSVSSEHTSITGTVNTAEPFEGIILIGLFPKPVPEGLPYHGTLISSTGDFCLTNVKPGTYYLMATSVSWKMNALDFLIPEKTLRSRSEKPIKVKPFSSVPHQHITLLPPRLDDPPILISLPLLMNNFLKQVRK